MAFRKRMVNKEEFFEINAKNCSEQELAEKLYKLIHTAYLTTGVKMKPFLGELWRRELNSFMENDSFEYLRKNDPVLIIDVIREDSRNGAEIASNMYLGKAVISLEFDLWLVENYREKRELKYEKFTNYIRRKYGRHLDKNLDSYKSFNLYGIVDYESIAKVLDLHYDQILGFFEVITANNKMRISVDDINAKRVEQTKEIPTPVVSEEHKEEDKKEEKPAVQESGISLEYEILIKEMQERIDKLERDIKEFKRQRDDAREYSVNQYDKGIKDLFSQMNDIRYGKVIDYFYSLLSAPDVDENLLSYLDNFFMILEDMEIEPIAGDWTAVVTEQNLTKDYNLDFEKKQYIEGGTEIKYVGWKYKDLPMEKPTLKLKEK